MGAPPIRDYRREDEPSWVRCRVLGFLGTGYFDDVLRAKPTYATASIELVATAPSDTVIGLVDVAIEGETATIESIAVHPDSWRRGIGTGLLAATISRLPVEVTVLDAWTREDPAANAWYLQNGFQETFRYLHVYAASDAEVASALPGDGRAGLTPVAGFFHAGIERERELRAEFGRVYVCRRYERSLRTSP